MEGGTVNDRARRRIGHDMVEWPNVACGDVRQPLLQLLDTDVEMAGDFVFGWCTTECVLELGDCALHRTRPGAHRPRYPGEGPQAVEDRTADARHGVRLELHSMIGVEFVDRIHETKDAGAHEIGGVDRLRQTRRETAGNELDEARVVDDQPLARTGLTVGGPVRPCRRKRVSAGASRHCRVVEGWRAHVGTDQARGCEAR